jgi:Fe2+ or Zn2+ uptake regulation protein
LNQKKERKTNQKKAIMDFLNKNTSHPTAEEVYESVKKKIPNISLGTVYRELKNLKNKRKIRAIEGEKKRFDYNTSNHAHFKCVGCGRVYDVIYDVDYKKVKGFDINYHELIFYGICKNCKGDVK